MEEIREKSEARVKKKTLKAVLEECQRALESLNDVVVDDDDDDKDVTDDDDDNDSKLISVIENCPDSPSCSDPLAEELCVLIKSRVRGPEFLGKLASAHTAQFAVQSEEGSSWDIVADNDLWEGGNGEDDEEEYVVVRQEDIVDGIACFMAAYLLSLKETKDLAPNKLQDALSKTFSLKKKKGKLRKALDGTKVIYNVASWSATAIGYADLPESCTSGSRFNSLLDLMPGHIKTFLSHSTRLGEAHERKPCFLVLF